MKQVKLKVAYGNGVLHHEVKAFLVAPGLAMHRDRSFKDEWTVTHILSGLAVFYSLPSKASAIRCAKALAKLGNWDRPRAKLPKGLLARGKKLRDRLSQKERHA